MSMSEVDVDHNQKTQSSLSVNSSSSVLGDIKASHPFPLFVIASSLLFSLLAIISRPNHAFVFAAQENFKLPNYFSLLTSKKYLIEIPKDKTGYVEAFALDTCPSYKEEVEGIDFEESILLYQNDYQYDYFIIHPGSTINAYVKVIEGSANVYLLQGHVSLLEMLRHGEKFNIKRYFPVLFVQSSDADEEGITLSYEVGEKNGRKGQVWILYYENTSESKNFSTIYAKYNIEATYFDLESYTPDCIATVGVTCEIQAKSCTILQAGDYDGDDDGDDNDDDDSVYNRANLEETEVNIVIARNWMGIILLSSIPFLIGLIQYRQLYSRQINLQTDGERFLRSENNWQSESASNTSMEDQQQNQPSYAPPATKDDKVSMEMTKLSEQNAKSLQGVKEDLKEIT